MKKYISSGKDPVISEKISNSFRIGDSKNLYIVGLLLLFFFSDCKRKHTYSEIEECDTMGNYYEDGEHYISREFLNDEEGTINYGKLFEKNKVDQTNCYPGNTFSNDNY